jgi:ribosomal protein S13
MNNRDICPIQWVLEKREEGKMGIKDISGEEKVKIALEAIIGEVMGRSSSEIAQRYPGISARAVTVLKNQALGAIREVFSEARQLDAPTGISEAEISAGLDRLLGSAPMREAALEEAEVVPPVSAIVGAIVRYNDRARKEGKPQIYISKSIVQEFGQHEKGEISEYFEEHKEEIDKHNQKHELKRTTNRVIKGQDWQSWLEI